MSERARQVESVMADWLEAHAEGDPPDVESLCAEHPDLAAAIREHVATLALVDAALGVDERGTPHERQIGDYEILREIGRGGMGVVFEARQQSMQRRVALKVLSRAVTTSEQAVQRFQREAQAAGRLHHTNIVPVYGMGRHKGLWFYAMELVQGEPLSRVLDAVRGSDARPPDLRLAWEVATVPDTPGASTPATVTPPPSDTGAGSGTGSGFPTQTEDRAWYARLAEMFAGVANALHTAHEEGIVHRDVKPDNLMVADDGNLKLVDFGLARLDDGQPAITRAGSMLGTLHYMSPEQARAGEAIVDHRTDVYSLGATMYEALTLSRPFGGRTPQDVVRRVIETDPMPPRRRNRRIPRDLETIVLKAMEKDPAQRYPTADAMGRDLMRFAEGAVIRARPIGWMGRLVRRVRRHRVRSALVAAAVLLVAIAFGLALRARQEERRRRAAEHVALLRDGQLALARSMARAADALFDPEPGLARGRALPLHDAAWEATLPGPDARALLSEAIALAPDDPEAWALRALAPGGTIEEHLADIEAATDRGLPPGTAELVRAHLLVRVGGLEPEQVHAILDGHVAPPAGHPLASLDTVLLADLHLDAGNVEASLGLLDQAADSSAAGSAVRYLALRTRAGVRFRRGDHRLALGDLHALRSLGEDTPAIRLSIARAWRQHGDAEAADATFTETLEHVRRLGDVDSWRALVLATRRGHAPWHHQATAAAIAARPEDPVLLAARAESLHMQGDGEEAVKLADRAVAHPDAPAVVFATRAWVVGPRGRLDEAARDLRRAIDLEPANHAWHERLGIVLREQGELEAAEQALRAARRLSLRCPSALRELAWLYQAMDRPDDARGLLEHALRLNPRNAVARAELGALHWNAFRDSEASLHHTRLALERRPDFPFALYNLAIVLKTSGREEEAIAALDQAAPPPEEALSFLTLRVDVLLGLLRHQDALDAAEEAVRRFPGEVDAYGARADVRLVLGDGAGAVEDAQTMVRLDPEDGSAHYQLGRTLHRLGRDEEAVAVLREALEIETSGRVLAVLGSSLDDLGRHEEAEATWRRAREVAPRDPVPPHNLALHLLEQGQPAEALEEARTAVTLSLRPSGRAASLGLVADCHRRLGDLDAARAAHDEAVAVAPHDPMAWARRGAFRHDAQGDAEGAESDFRQALALDEDHRPAWRNLGVALLTQGRAPEAVAVWREAIARGDDGELMVWMRLGRALAHLHRFEEAVDAFAEAEALAPDRPGPPYQQAQSLLELGRLQDALDAIERAFAIDPQRRDIAYDRAYILMQQGHLDRSLEAYRDAIAIDEQWPLAWWGLGSVHDARGEPDAALAAYEKAIARAPGWAWPYNDAGLVLQQRGEHEAAIERFTQALERDEHLLVAWRNRARSRLELGQTAKSLADAERAHALDPEGPYTLHLLADMLWHVGRLEEAYEHLEKAARLDEHDRRWHRLAQLDLLREQRAFERLRDLARTSQAAWPGDARFLRAEVEALRALGEEDAAARRAAAALEALEAPGDDEGDPLPRAYLEAAAGRAEAAVATLGRLGPEPTRDQRFRAAVVYAVLGDAEAARASVAAYLDEGGCCFPPGSALPSDLERLAQGHPALESTIARMRTSALAPGEDPAHATGGASR